MNAWIKKLEGFGPLSDRDVEWLAAVSAGSEQYARDVDLVSEGNRAKNVCIVLEGFAFRYKVTREGRRQIFAYLIPGDFCDLHTVLLKEMDHSIRALTPCKVASISTAEVTELSFNRPALAKAFWWCTLVDEAILREWIVGMGQRQAPQRIAHLFCELYVRMRSVGIALETFALPLTQSELGDTVGLSTVHVNRSLKRLREAGLLSFEDNSVVVRDIDKLMRFADFQPGYLHMQA